MITWEGRLLGARLGKKPQMLFFLIHTYLGGIYGEGVPNG